MIDEKKFKRLQTRAAKAREVRDRARGQLDAVMGRLADEFGCGSIEEAEAKADELSAQAEEAAEEYNRAVAVFEEEWDERLNEDD